MKKLLAFLLLWSGIAQAQVSPYPNGSTIPALTHGMVCNGSTISNVTTTVSSATVSSTSYSFASPDVGKYITIPGAGAAAGPLNATISSVSGGAATLSTTASTAIAGTGTATFGTADDAAMQTLVTATAAAGGGLIELPTGTCVITSTVLWGSNVSMRGQGAGKSILKWISSGNMTTGVIYNNGNSGNCTATYAKTNYANIHLSYFEVDGLAATVASYLASAKGIGLACSYNISIDHVYVHDTPATCIATDFGQPSLVTNDIAENCGRLSNTAAGGNGIGQGTLGLARESYVIANNVIINPAHYGIILEGQNTGATVQVSGSITGNVVLEGSASTNSSGYLDAGIGIAGSYGGVIVGNYVYGNGSNAFWSGINVDAGSQGTTDPAGAQVVIEGNQINSTYVGILVNYIASNPVTYKALVNINGNSVFNSYLTGIQIETNGSTAGYMDGVNISGNISCGNGSAGILFVSTANIAATNVTVNGNTLCNNGQTVATNYRQAGLATSINIAGLTFVGNTIYDNLGTHKQIYGFGIASGVTVSGADIQSNKFTASTSVFDNLGTLTGSVINNPGYNPVGTSAISVGASPFTYTAGNSPATVYISGGTVSSITKNGSSLPTTVTAVPMAPNDAIIVTYTVAPTMLADVN